MKRSENIHIMGRRPSFQADSAMNLSKQEYYKISLADYYSDSLIRVVSIHQDCIAAISEWTHKSLEKVEPSRVNEVGGFMLGSYMQKDDQYEVALQVFFPIRQVESQSPVSLVMGVDIAVAYGKLMDRYPNMGIVGWFHTHPGHTPYLSRTDLDMTHNVFFQHPYQLAIVLDALTSGFDTGIFTRKMDMSMNNAIDCSTWISWKQLTDQVKRTQT